MRRPSSRSYARSPLKPPPTVPAVSKTTTTTTVATTAFLCLVLATITGCAGVSPLVAGLRVEDLSGNTDLWGGPVTDERYALIAHV